MRFVLVLSSQVALKVSQEMVSYKFVLIGFFVITAYAV